MSTTVVVPSNPAPVAAVGGGPLLRQLGQGLRRAIETLPPDYRFAAAVHASAPLVPLLARTTAAASFRRHRINSERDIALHLVLGALARAGTRYHPVLHVEGRDALALLLDARPDAGEGAGEGALLVAPHALLGTLVLRLLADAGRDLTIVAASPTYDIPGAARALPTVQPAPHFLLRVRARLREGSVVCAMIDHDEPVARHAGACGAPGGEIYVTDALFRLAEHRGARVVFVTAHLDGGRVRATFGAPPRGAPAGEMTARFLDFVATDLARLGLPS